MALKNVAVILAGGKGVRLGNEKPKQFLKIAGKMVIEHTLEVFESHPMINEIVVVSNIDYIEKVEEIALGLGYKKLKKILIGGKERYDSSLAAIRAYDGEDINFLFHDAVRPLISHRIISDCINALEEYNVVDVAVKTTDTIIKVDSRIISEIPDRDFLFNGQTPQCFKSGVIKLAYDKALNDPAFKATDDCGVVKRYLPDEEIYVVEGEQFNMKLTYKEDFFLLDKLFQLKSVTSQISFLSEGAKAELKNKVIIVFGGTYGIGKDIVDVCNENGAKVYSYSRGKGVDISNVSDVKRAFEEVLSREKVVNYVINTAAILEKQALHNMSYEDIIKSIQVNYLGAVILAKESYKHLSQSKGALLLYTSSSYTRGRGLYSLYSSSKAAIVNLVQALSEEWDHATICCINPERTKTPMRIKNFGIEPENSLLSSMKVALVSIDVLLSGFSGQVIDVKL
jgi:2-C-methyl-D-erythritol 4-phosphate cytidylyltransferase